MSTPSGRPQLPPNLPRYPYVKQGKVVCVHRESHSVDVQLLDGQMLERVPVLTSMAGSITGAALLVAPSVYRPIPAAKTYPWDLLSPAIDRSDIQHPESNTGDSSGREGRDIYAALLQMEGTQRGMTGYCCIGFFYGQSSELLFPGIRGNDTTYHDFWIVRSPADYEMTLDKWAKLSLQHPSGSRLTNGVDLNRVRLYHQDWDRRYRIRNRRTPLAGWLVMVPERTTDEGIESSSRLYEEWGANGTNTTFTNRGNIVEQAVGKSGNILETATKNIEENAGGKILMTAGIEIRARAPMIYLN